MNAGRPGGDRRSAARRAAVFALITVALLIAGTRLPGLGEMRAAVEAVGPAAPLAVLGLYLVAALLLVPRPLLNAATGALLGPAAGFAVASVGAVVGALVQFWAARLMLRGAVHAWVPPAVRARLDRAVERHGLFAVVYLRLMPIAPFSAINHGLGATAMSAWRFALGTAVGCMPYTAAMVLLGGSAADPLSPGFLAAGAGTALLVAAGHTAVVLMRRAERARAAGDGRFPETPYTQGSVSVQCAPRGSRASRRAGRGPDHDPADGGGAPPAAHGVRRP
ncbi:TVP38/TMEM64 family protein [Nocardiopsis suaedae]|uniref:TVP38/TMEM64 family membrane protein n=1 Tax=Nocardiopsis suaedae TaxID=3018444 RepID=A0ABT4TH28_9ACTN|nr:VTT domain-containing protein [Nocardiopsis suaedae]MDA2803966.1 VTT domain-containing protein [Nocardiopsis suaedae]